LFLAWRWTLSLAAFASARALKSLTALVLPRVTSWAAEDKVAGGVAALADIRQLAGTGATPGWTNGSETHRPSPGSLAGRVGIRAVAVTVVRAGADNIVQLS